MGRSVTITTPIPTLEEVGKRLKMSKARQRRLIEIVRGSTTGRFAERREDGTVPVDSKSRDRNSDVKTTIPQKAGVGSASGKTSKHAAAS
jgi:hypothetical protein